MEFKSLQDLIRYVDSAFALKFYSGASVLRKGVLKVIASVIGGSLYMLSLLCKRIWKNRFLTTCEVSWLDGFGVEYELPHKAPTYARGTVKVALASGSSTASVPAGTYLIDPLTNLEYRTLLSASVTASSLQIRVVAVSPGSDYNVDAGTVLSWRDATPTGLEDSCEVVKLYGGYSVAVSIDGVEQVWGESAEEYRQRLLYRERHQPHGGCDSDYKIWAERFDFVTKAYVIPNSPHANSVSVILANYHTPEIELPFDEVEKVSAYIKSASRRVLTADVRVYSVNVANFAVTASVMPNNEDVKDSVRNAINAFFMEKNPGTSALFDQVIDYVRSNSLAESMTINSVMKDGNLVSSFILDYDPDLSIGEVGKVTMNFVSAG